jgi:hypothetical protein
LTHPTDQVDGRLPQATPDTQQVCPEWSRWAVEAFVGMVPEPHLPDAGDGRAGAGADAAVDLWQLVAEHTGGHRSHPTWV